MGAATQQKPAGWPVDDWTASFPDARLASSERYTGQKILYRPWVDIR